MCGEQLFDFCWIVVEIVDDEYVFDMVGDFQIVVCVDVVEIVCMQLVCCIDGFVCGVWLFEVVVYYVVVVYLDFVGFVWFEWFVVWFCDVQFDVWYWLV